MEGGKKILKTLFLISLVGFLLPIIILLSGLASPAFVQGGWAYSFLFILPLLATGIPLLLIELFTEDTRQVSPLAVGGTEVQTKLDRLKRRKKIILLAIAGVIVFMFGAPSLLPYIDSVVPDAVMMLIAQSFLLVLPIICVMLVLLTITGQQIKSVLKQDSPW